MKLSDISEAVQELSINDKASVLASALPWLKELHGATVVIKFGGNAMVDDELKRNFAADVVFLKLAGLNPVVVHGGGPQINSMLSDLDIDSNFKGGHRETTSEIMDVVQMVLTGKVQREIVNLINRHKPLAVGVSGEDASLFTAKKHLPVVDGEPTDIGFVGDIVDVNPNFIDLLIADDLIPVVSSVAASHDGTVYNVNADVAAGRLAAALGAQKLVMMTDVPGLYANWPDTDEVISEINTDELAALLPTLESGMIPKMQSCLDSVTNGVGRAHIIDGRVKHSMLLEVFTDTGIGTMVTCAQPSSHGGTQ